MIYRFQVIQVITENSSTFKDKTVYSQEKYVNNLDGDSICLPRVSAKVLPHLDALLNIFKSYETLIDIKNMPEIRFYIHSKDFKTMKSIFFTFEKIGNVIPTET